MLYMLKIKYKNIYIHVSIVAAYLLWFFHSFIATLIHSALVYSGCCFLISEYFVRIKLRSIFSLTSSFIAFFIH